MKKTERFLITLAIICIASVGGVQIIYAIGKAVPASIIANEGSVSYIDSSVYRKGGQIKIKLSPLEEAELLINGEKAEPLGTDGEYNIYIVYDKDVIELDLRKTADEEISVFVAETSQEIIFPKSGTKMFVKGGIKKLFTISITDEPNNAAQ